MASLICVLGLFLTHALPSFEQEDAFRGKTKGIYGKPSESWRCGTNCMASHNDDEVFLLDSAHARLGRDRFKRGVIVDGVRWTPDSKSILVQTSQRAHDQIAISLWDAKTGRLLRTVTVQDRLPAIGNRALQGGIWEVSPDAKYLLTHNTVTGRDVPTVSPLRVREIKTGRIVYESADGLAQFSPDSRQILDLLHRRLINLATGKIQRLRYPQAQLGVFGGTAQFSPDGRLLVVGERREGLEVWHLVPPKKVVRLRHKIGYFEHFKFAPDSKRFAMITASEEEKEARLILVDAATGIVARDFGGFEPENLLFSPDGKQLAAVVPKVAEGERQPSRETVRRWNVQTGKQLAPIETRNGVAMYSPNGRLLAIAKARSIVLLDSVTSEERTRIQLDESVPKSHGDLMLRWYYIGNRAAFSPDSRKFAVAVGGTVRQFDAVSGKEIRPAK